MKKVLILSAGFGSGHNQAANALSNYCKDINIDVEMIDLLDILGYYGKIFNSLYENNLLSSKFWKHIFNFTDNNYFTNFFSIPFIQSKVNNIVNNYNPNIIISTHFMRNSLIKKYINVFGKSFKYGIVITDSINIHYFWYNNNCFVDKFFVIDKYTKEKFITKFAYKKNNIVVSGFPIESKYFINKDHISNKNIAIVLSNQKEDIIIGILNKFKNTNFSIKIIGGRNKKLLNKLKKLFYGIKNFTFYDFLNIKENLLNIDIMITKAGGAIVNECIAGKIPIIVTNYIRGQEEGNIEIISIYNIGIYETDPDKIYNYIYYLDKDSLLLNFNKIEYKKSCEKIVQELIL